MNEVDLHVVLGASGGAGNAIARALSAAGHEVRAVNRSGQADLPEDIERWAADIMSPPDLDAALQDADVVYMAAQPPYHRWAHDFEAMLQHVIEATARVRARLVMVDNLYAYGATQGPMSERTPQSATDTKGVVRARMAEQLLGAHSSGRVHVAIGRASDYFGPRADNSTITALAIEAAAEGKMLRWVGSMDAPHAVAYLPDVARAYVVLGTSPQSDGKVWILPHAPAVTGRKFLKMINRMQPQPLKTGTISGMMLRVAAPFHSHSRELLGIRYQWEAPYEVDDSAFQSAFGPFRVTPLEEALATTLEWYRARPRNRK